MPYINTKSRYGINFAGWEVSVDSYSSRYAAGNVFTFTQCSDIKKLVLDAVGIDPFGNAVRYALNGPNQRINTYLFPGVLPFLNLSGGFTFAFLNDSVQSNT